MIRVAVQVLPPLLAQFCVVPSEVPSNPYDESVLARSWERHNIGGGGALQAVAVSAQGKVLVGSDLSGAYWSPDGLNFRPIGSAHGLTATHVSAVAFDTAEDEIHYVGTDRGLYRRASRWAPAERVLNHPSGAGMVGAIVLSPADAEVGYVALHSGYNQRDARIHRSEDRGHTWVETANVGLPTDLWILKLVADAVDPDRVYALAGEGRFTCSPPALFRSEDGAASWVELDLGAEPVDVVLDPEDAAAIYVSTFGTVDAGAHDCATNNPGEGFVYRSGDHGDSFAAVTTVSRRNSVLWPVAGSPGVVRMIDNRSRKVFETDGATEVEVGSAWGDGWEPGWSGRQIPGRSYAGLPNTIAYHPTDPDRMWWVDAQFLWATDNGGQMVRNITSEQLPSGSWRSRGIENTVMLDLSVSQADPDFLLIGYADVGCVRSLDGGESFSACNAPDLTGWYGASGGNSMTVLTDPDRAGVVWATFAQTISSSDPVAGHHTLAQSVDHATTWTPQTTGLPAGVQIPSGLSLSSSSPVNNRTLFVTYDGDVFRSVDDGWSWTEVFACDGCRYTAVHPSDGQVVYAGGEAGLWRSTDGGSTFAEVGDSDWHGSGSAFWSGRTSWSGVSRIRFDPVAPHAVYVTVRKDGRGLYVSDEGHAGSWRHERVDDFLYDVAVLADGTVFTACAYAVYSGSYSERPTSVQRRLPGRQDFGAFDRGMPWPDARLLGLTADEQELWVAAPGAGLLKHPL